LGCIGDLFTGAKGIQNWLNMCARLVAKSIAGARIPEALEEAKAKKKVMKGRKAVNLIAVDFLKREQMSSVVWTTPLGLPVVQPYRKPKKKQVMTTMQTVYISDPNMLAEGVLLW
jgi:DNA-directed RNA polymerase, mitochondrial